MSLSGSVWGQRCVLWPCHPSTSPYVPAACTAAGLGEYVIVSPAVGLAAIRGGLPVARSGTLGLAGTAAT